MILNLLIFTNNFSVSEWLVEHELAGVQMREDYERGKWSWQVLTSDIYACPCDEYQR